jgi:hypothetical protein
MRYDYDSRKYHSAAQDAQQIMENALIEPGLYDLEAAEAQALHCHAISDGTDEGHHWSSVLDQVQMRVKVLRTMRDYTGYPRQEYRMVQDPKHPWMWAVRDESDEDHLVNLKDGEVEWVEYSSWPPRSYRS